MMMGAVIGMTGAAFIIDESVRSSALRSQGPQMDKITNVGENFGNAKYGTVLSGALYLGGHIFKDKYVRETGQILAEAMLVNGLYTMLLKITLGRARPYTNKTRSEFDPFESGFETAENSFPSGHTSTAFTIATVLSERIDNIYVSIGLYSLATLTAYQRIYSDVHWLSDTLLGAALGTFIGLKVVKLHRNYSPNRAGFNIKIFPQITSSSYGVGFAMIF